MARRSAIRRSRSLSGSPRRGSTDGPTSDGSTQDRPTSDGKRDDPPRDDPPRAPRNDPPRKERHLMAETHKPPETFKLRMRRYDPESGEAPYWDEHTVELEPHRSVLEGILQAKAKHDGSIGIRCSCRAAICGACGGRINGEPGLACHTHLDHARQSARDGFVIEIEPMGNMPVI